MVLEHQQVLNTVRALCRLTAAGGDVAKPQVCCQLAPATSAIHLLDIFCALDAGSTLLIGPQTEPLALTQWLAHNKVTRVLGLPAVMQGLNPAEVPSLQCGIYTEMGLGAGGGLEGGWGGWVGNGGSLWQTSGRPECGMTVLQNEGGGRWKPLPGVQVRDLLRLLFWGAARWQGLMGCRCWYSQVYILGEEREILPVGVAGELCVAGSQVARGYWAGGWGSDEDSVFVPNPFAEGQSNAILVCTGDRAQWLPDGSILSKGRLREDKVGPA